MSESSLYAGIKAGFEEVREKAAEAAKKAGRGNNDYKIIAVSKTHPVEYIYAGIEAGISDFGENYAQEFKDKCEAFENSGRQMPEWHFIGHLQRNKVKYIAPYVTMVHSVDSAKLAREIDKRAAENNRNIGILLQVNTSGEDSKSGCAPEDIVELARETRSLENITVKGLMTIGTFTPDESLQRKEFLLLRKCLERVNSVLGTSYKELSMGMTGDYPVAIDEGATYVRVGTAIFGERDYNK